jgi:hypothetical protein
LGFGNDWHQSSFPRSWPGLTSLHWMAGRNDRTWFHLQGQHKRILLWTGNITLCYSGWRLLQIL